MIDEVVVVVLDSWVKIICDRVKNKWDNMEGIKGRADIEAGLPFIIGNIIGNTIISTINTAGQKAWIAEFGSGSLSDLRNPYLDAYVNSPSFNQYRSTSDMTIRGRDKGEYTDLDGNPQYSSGTAAGRDLELKPVYQGMTSPAFHVVKQEIEDAFPELVLDIKQAIRDDIFMQLDIKTHMYT